MSLLTKAAKWIEKTLSLVSNRAGNLVVIVLVAMVLLTVVDIVLRRVFNNPLPSSFELIGLMLVVVVYFSVSIATHIGKHVSIDVLVTRFPPKAQEIISVVADFFGAGLFAVVTWRCIVQGLYILGTGRISGVMKIPLYPFYFVIAFGTMLATIAILVRIVNSITKESRV